MHITEELRRIKPLSETDRLGMNRDSEYLGAIDLDPEIEPVLTIGAIYNGMVTLQRGKENKDVLVFEEDSVPGLKNVRPLIVNATNRKTLKKLYGSLSVGNLVGKKVQLYIDSNVRDPSTGERTEGIRIRQKKPSVAPAPVCADCGNPIKASGKFTAQVLADMTRNQFGRPLCVDCAKRAKQNSTEQTGNEMEGAVTTEETV